MRRPLSLYLPCVPAAALAACLAAFPAIAAPTIYTDRVVFDAALAALGGTVTNQRYEGLDSALWGTFAGTITPTGFNFTFGGVSADSPDDFFVTRDLLAGNTYLSTAFAAAPDRRLTITVPATVQAIGMHLLEYQSPDTAGDDPITVSALGASQTLNGSPLPDSPQFWGVIDPNGIGTTLTIERSDEVLYPLSFDNLVYATIEVPEPASAALLLGGLTLLVRLRSRR